jgi:hypothetical protein
MYRKSNNIVYLRVVKTIEHYIFNYIALAVTICEENKEDYVLHSKYKSVLLNKYRSVALNK